MKRFTKFWWDNWRVLLAGTIGFGLLVSLLTWRLYKIAPGFSPLELQYLSGTGSLKAILLNPVYLPYKIGEYIVLKLGFDGVLAARLVVASMAAMTASLFFLLLRGWHTTRVAVLGTLLFISSSWFLHIGRSAVPFILFPLTIMVFIYLANRAHNTSRPRLTLLVLALTIGIAVYIPAMSVLMLVIAIWQRNYLWGFVKNSTIWVRLLAVLILTIMLLPAGYAIFNNPSLIKDFLALPTSFNWFERLKQLVIVPYQLLISGPEDASLWLGKLPILDVFGAGMMFVGAFVYFKRISTARSSIIFGVLGVLTLVIGLSSLPVYGAIPIVYLLIAAGVSLLLQQWFTVFPRNPLARGLGLGIVVVAVLLSCWFHASRYFIAWANSPETTSSFTSQQRR